MKKFAIATKASGVRVVNANEYNVAPKTNAFKATVLGVEEFAASTSGKGKSAIPNYYLYFRCEGVLYYFRSAPEEIESARRDGFVVDNEKEADRLTPEEKAPETPTATPAAEPKVRRRATAKV